MTQPVTEYCFESLSMPDTLAFEKSTEVLIVGKLISILLVIKTSFDLFSYFSNRIFVYNLAYENIHNLYTFPKHAQN